MATKLLNAVLAQQEATRRSGMAVKDLQADDPSLPNSDTQGTGPARRYTSGGECRVLCGKITYALPHYGWYRVTPYGRPAVVCCLLQQTAVSPVGVRRVGAIGAGATVYFVWHPQARYGAIIGVDPPFSQTGRDLFLHDVISGASATTPASDPATAFTLATKDAALADFSAGSMLDETTAGEYGHAASTGTAQFVDEHMACLKADDNCGFWSFVIDQLSVIRGHNLDMWSMLCERSEFDDQDELSGYTGHTPYAQEAIGRFDVAAAGRRNDARTIQMTEPDKGETDVIDPLQVRFDRLRQHYGFLGQGFRKTLVLPPAEEGIHKRGTEVLGVFDESLSLAGDYRLATARGFSMLHVPVFPVPVRVFDPADPNGDDRETGYVPGGEGQKIAAEPSGDLPDGIGAALVVDDDLAYGQNWRAQHPFHYHTKDFQTAEVDEEDGQAEAPLDTGALDSKQYTPRPTPTTRRVDHRYEADYHPTVSGIATLPDGTVVILGPAGEEIRMAGGSIEISCPGDVVLRPGRNLVTMAGRNTIVRAKDCVELSATDGDFRIKSARHGEILAGNSGVGVLLLESRGAGSAVDFKLVGADIVAGGVIVKSVGQTALLSETVYVRAGMAGSGSIVLDAGAGTGVVSVYAASLARFVTSAFDFFVSGDEVTATNAYGEAGTVLSGGLQVDGPAILSDGLLCGGWIEVSDGHIATSDADSYRGLVATLKEESLDEAVAAVKGVGDTEAEQSKAGDKLLNDAVVEPYLGTDKIGSAEVLPQVGFSFRTTAQYGTGDYVLYESRWAQRARITESATRYWEEDPVQAGSEQTYPYPGRDAWLGETYRTVDPTLYDPRTGKAEPPGTSYEDATYGTPEEAIPDGNYPVV